MKMIKMNTPLSPIARLALLLAGLLVTGLCRATPVFNVPDAFGMRGKPVEVSLIDEAITDLDSATLKATFDPVFLEFSNATAGDLAADGFTALPGIPYTDGALMAVDISLAGPSTLSGSTGSILALIFGILPNAPLGVTPVSFESLNTDYEVPKTTGYVHVTTPVPEPGIFVLLLPALLLMRYRGKGEAEQHLS